MVTSPCNWTTTADNAWITVDYGGGVGVGSVTYSVQPNPGVNPRQGALHIEGQPLTIMQAGIDCTISADPASYNIGALGGTFELRIIATDAQCPWTAASTESWIVVSTATGSGTQTVTFVVSENTALSTRHAMIRAAEQTIPIEQSGKPAAAPKPSPAPSPSPSPQPAPSPSPIPSPTACPASIDPTSTRVPASGGTFFFSVTATADCKWSVSTGTAWIAVETGSGAGSGRGAYVVRPNTGGARDGQLRVGSQTISITQDAVVKPTCTVTLSPPSQSVSSDGGTFFFKVSTDAGCAWAVESAPSWISLRSKSGSGSAEVGYAVALNTGATRSDAIVVSGQALKVVQAGK
jgi:hypothetical protein